MSNSVWVECPFKDCGHRWQTEALTDWITCSKCGRKFKREEGLVQETSEDLQNTVAQKLPKATYTS